MIQKLTQMAMVFLTEKIVGGIYTTLKFQSGSAISVTVMTHYPILSSGHAMTMNTKERRCALMMTTTVNSSQISIVMVKKNIQ